MNPLWIALLVGLATGSLGFPFLDQGAAPEWALLPVTIVAVQQILGLRLLLSRQNRVHYAAALICLMLAAWYFLPLLFYGINTELINPENVFQENLFLKAGYGMLALVSAFQFGLYRGFVGLNVEQKAEDAVSLNLAQNVALCALLLLIGVLGYLLRPDFSVDEFDQFLDSYNAEFALSSNRASSIAQAGGLLTALAVREFFLKRRFAPLLCALLPLYNALMLAVVNGRRQVIFQVGSMIVFGILVYARRPLRLLLSLGLPAVLLFAIGGVYRTNREFGSTPADMVSAVLVQPVHELSQTSSYHSRLIYSQMLNGPLNGITYAERYQYLVPLISYVIGAPTDTAYYHKVILETVDWAGQYYYTMGSSLLSELYANFGPLSPLVAVALGWVVGRLLVWLFRRSGSLFPYLLGAIAFSALIWSTRCSLSDLYPQTRFIVMSGVLAWAFGLLGRAGAPVGTGRSPALSALPAPGLRTG